MASPLFDPKLRPQDPRKLADAEICKLLGARKNEEPVIVSVETTPGIFLLAHECVCGGFEFPRLTVPWGIDRPLSKIHLIELNESASVQNGKETKVIDQPLQVTLLLKAILLRYGCHVVMGFPTRFDRKVDI